MGKKVAVLMGGWSSEREVSLVSGEACAEALNKRGFEAVTLDVPEDLEEFIAKLKEINPDVAFNALHGKWGEDGCIQSVLELLKIPYTHSGPLASALAMDKDKAQEVLSSAGVQCITGKIVPIEDIKAGRLPYPKPFVIKPNSEGSSCGIYIVRYDDDIPDMSDWVYGDYALVQKYIAGSELSVSVIDREDGSCEALTVTEINTELDFYNYEAKYSDGGSSHTLPAEIPSDIFVKAIERAELAHKKLGCSGVSRSDFRFNRKEGSTGLYFLETNTQPGMTPTSLVPEQAEYRKISFGELVSLLVETAKLHN